MSKLQFRARALDATKPMPIYMAEELPDLTDYSAINRAVPLMPSGMEKEEECEHHLQRAICTGLIIPTPEVASMADTDCYDRLYTGSYKQPRQLIHMQPFAMEQDIPDYDMDSEDEIWVQEQAQRLDLTYLKFESMMDRLEKSSGQTVVTLHDAKALLKEDDDLIIAIFDYWLNKRLKTQHPLILAVKTENRLGSSASNPYIAFRRRTEKMQTRKNRKNDETSYEKMLKLRRDLSRAVTLLELVKRREKTKREHLHLTIEIVEKRYQAQDFSGALLSEVSALRASRPAFAPLFPNQFPNQNWSNKVAVKDEILPRKEKRQYKKRKHKSTNSHSGRHLLGETLLSSDDDELTPSNVIAASPEEPESDPDEGRYAFRRNKLSNYYMQLSSKLGNWPWCSREENGTADMKYRYTLTSIRRPKPRCIGFARRRIGRGGRVCLDRLSTPYDDLWRRMDFTITERVTIPERLAFRKALENSNKKDIVSPTDDIDLTSLPALKTDSSDNKINDLIDKNHANVTPALRNLYSEHNYNSTTMDSEFTDNYNTSCTASPKPSTIQFPNLIKKEVDDFGMPMEEDKSSNYNNVQVKEEDTQSLINITTNVANELNARQDTSELHERLRSNDTPGNIVNLDEESPAYGINDFDEDSMWNILKEVKQDWLHFRPKTPPPNYEEPCYLLPAKDYSSTENENVPLTINIDNFMSSPPSALCDTSTFTTEFTLNDLYTEFSLDSQLLEETMQRRTSFSSSPSPPHSGDGGDDLGLILNDTRQSNVATDVTNVSSCSVSNSDNSNNCNSSTNNEAANDLTTQFGCSRVTISSDQCSEQHLERLSSNLLSDSFTDNCNKAIVTATVASTSSSTASQVSWSTSVQPKRNFQLVRAVGGNFSTINRNLIAPTVVVSSSIPPTSSSSTSSSPKPPPYSFQSILSNTLTSPNKCYSLSNTVSDGSGVTTAQASVPTSRWNFDGISSGTTSNASTLGTTATMDLGSYARNATDVSAHTNGPMSATENSPRRVSRVASMDESFSSGESPRFHRIPNNSISINSQVRRALLTAQTMHTLNSNSANIIESSTNTTQTSSSPEIKLTTNTTPNDNNMKMKSAIQHHIQHKNADSAVLRQQQNQQTAALNNKTTQQQQTAASQQTNNKQMMRKNNTLAMEVT